ncbi:Ubiquitin-Like Protein 4B [Manis pentadactyla]|nr:Ubiquitin-Like Protein 4B [Manis pentadactyla]
MGAVPVNVAPASADDKQLSNYCMGPNASISVIMWPPEKMVPEEACQCQPLWHHLGQVLAKPFGPQDAKAVLQLLKQEHKERLQRISLGDLEQLAQHLLKEEPLVEPTGQGQPEAASEPCSLWLTLPFESPFTLSSPYPTAGQLLPLLMVPPKYLEDRYSLYLVFGRTGIEKKGRDHCAGPAVFDQADGLEALTGHLSCVSPCAGDVRLGLPVGGLCACDPSGAAAALLKRSGCVRATPHAGQVPG